jgi:membrane-associated phospholipid phosphatase
MRTFLILLCCSLTLTASGQQDRFSTYVRDVKVDKAYIHSYYKDITGIATAPLHWNQRQLLTATAVLGAGALLSTQDLKIRDFFQTRKTPFTEKVTRYGLEPWGSGAYSMALLGGLYLYGSLNNDNRSREAAMLGVKAYLITGLITQVTKHIIHRQRPYQVDKDFEEKGTPRSQYNFKGPFGNYRYTSFPSGHTVSAFAVATILSSIYKDKKAVPIVSYSVATLTALSRVHDNRHWASDIFVGAAFGYAMSKMIYNTDKWGIHPSPSGDVMGFTVVIPLR